MLRFMRRHKRSAVVKGLLVIIILVFVGWGVGSYEQARQTASVAIVNGIPITVAELNRAHQNLLQTYQELYGAAYSPELVRQLDLQGRVLDELITAALLIGEAQQLGLRVSDQEVADSIRGIGVFSPDGRFDKEVYLRFLRISQLTDQEFVEQQRKVLLVQRVESLVIDGTRVSDEELRDRYRIEHQQITLRYVRLPWQSERDSVSVSEEDLAAHYDANRTRYQLPERAAFEYVAYLPDEFAAELEPSEEETTAYYEKHLTDRFTAPAQVQVRQLGFPPPFLRLQGRPGGYLRLRRQRL